MRCRGLRIEDFILIMLSIKYIYKCILWIFFLSLINEIFKMMKTMNEARKYTSPIIQEALRNIDPTRREMVRRRMMISARIDDALKSKSWTQKQLADIMNKRPSEVTKWLSGNHNFTLETIALIEKNLGITLITVSEEVII
jgi:ribosome-binding protein aMBF1 (putative translation factor)